jgi:hypothetical protein
MRAGENPMKTQKLNLLSRLFLITSLLTSLFLGSSAAAVSPDKPASAGLQTASQAPSLITIPELPIGVGAPKVDGVCDSKTEYAYGVFYTFTDGPSGTGTGNVYLLHDADYLYMCILSPIGSYSTRFDSLYLDPQVMG